MALTVAVDVPAGDREVLRSWTRSPSMRAGLAQRARIVLLAADGVSVKGIVERVGVSKPTVIGWKKRYAAEGIDGLTDRPKPGRPVVVDETQVVLATLEPPPDRLGVTHWSSRLLAGELGISHVWVSKISTASALAALTSQKRCRSCFLLSPDLPAVGRRPRHFHRRGVLDDDRSLPELRSMISTDTPNLDGR